MGTTSGNSGIFWANYYQDLGFPGPATGVIWALRAQSWKKSRKTGPRGPGAQKVENGVEKVEKQSILTLFRLRFRLFGVSRPWELILRLFFQLWARRAQMTPVRRKSFRKPGLICTGTALQRVSTTTLWHKIITYEKWFWNNLFWKITNFVRNFQKKKSLSFRRFWERKFPQKFRKIILRELFSQ